MATTTLTDKTIDPATVPVTDVTATKATKVEPAVPVEPVLKAADLPGAHVNAYKEEALTAVKQVSEALAEAVAAVERLVSRIE